MKTSLILFTILAVLVLTSAPAAANPTMLPKHPGYAMDKATDPVKGQSLANDPGQQNATGDKGGCFRGYACDAEFVSQSQRTRDSE
jgi:hypothetical protein